MKSKFIFIALISCFGIILSCSKSSTPKTPECSSASDCIVNTWNIQSFTAHVNGSNVNLSTSSGWQWVFSSNLWTENVENAYHQSGPWKISTDETKLQLMGSIDTAVWNISNVDAQNLTVSFQFDHVHPDQASINVAASAGIDTSALSGFTAFWAKQ